MIYYPFESVRKDLFINYGVESVNNARECDSVHFLQGGIQYKWQDEPS